jgi:hypothetical protein
LQTRDLQRSAAETGGVIRRRDRRRRCRRHARSWRQLTQDGRPDGQAAASWNCWAHGWNSQPVPLHTCLATLKVVDDHRCIDDKLCDACLGRELLSKRGQAEAVGQIWAEQVCREELRAQPAWPADEPKTLAIARRRVARLARDPRLLDALAQACSAGAAAWWQRRPPQYRIERAPATATWSLVTAPDELERCMFAAAGGVRCERRTEWRIGCVAGLDHAYLCGVHLDVVRQPGQLAEPVVQPG